MSRHEQPASTNGLGRQGQIGLPHAVRARIPHYIANHREFKAIGGRMMAVWEEGASQR